MQHILMSSSAHQCCVSSGLIQENIGVLFYLQVSGHHFTRRAYSEIAYSAEYRLQTKWICSSLQQKLVTELRQNFLLFLLFFFFFLRKEQVENKNSSSQLWCSFFLLCSQQKNLNVPILSEKPRAMFFILVLCFIFTITSLQMLILHNFLIKKLCSLPNRDVQYKAVQRNQLNTFPFLPFKRDVC